MKDALTQELQEADLRSSRAASEASETSDKAPRLEAAAGTSAAAAAESPPPPPPPSKSSLMKEFDQILEECEDPGEASTTSTAAQVHTFFTERTIATSDNPYYYWGVNRDRFPNLAATARKFLCAPCTSVESERLFSTASNIVDEKRNRLTPERAEMLIFMRKNLPLLLK